MTVEPAAVYHDETDNTSSSGEADRFVADSMLGTLAKWLRILGYDTVYRRNAPDLELVRLARAERRVLLTRDRPLSRARNVLSIWIEGQDLDDQIAQVLHQATAPARPFSRCPNCNAALQDAGLDDVRELVPPYVAQTQTRFTRCPSCGRVYWPGTHRAAMQKRLDALRGRLARDPRTTSAR